MLGFSAVIRVALQALGVPLGVGGGSGSLQVGQRQQVDMEKCWVGVGGPGEELPSASCGSGVWVRTDA